MLHAKTSGNFFTERADTKLYTEPMKTQPNRRITKDKEPSVRLSQQAATFVNSTTTAKSSVIDLRNPVKEKSQLDSTRLAAKAHPIDEVYYVTDVENVFDNCNKSTINGLKSQSSSRTTTPIDLSATKHMSSRHSLACGSSSITESGTKSNSRKRMLKDTPLNENKLPVQDLTVEEDSFGANISRSYVPASGIRTVSAPSETVDLTADSQSQSYNLGSHFDSFDDNNNADTNGYYGDTDYLTPFDSSFSSAAGKSSHQIASANPPSSSSSSHTDTDSLIDSLNQPINSKLCCHAEKILSPAVDDRNSKPILLVDKAERVDQKKYREFFLSVQNSMTERVPQFECVEVPNLHLGDFMFVKGDHGFEGTDANKWNFVTNGIVIERKCVSDIVSRSTDETPCAPHVRQERRLRLCGLQKPFFLIEGQFKKNNHTMPKPLVNADWDFEKPDVVANEVDIMRFLAAVVSRNFKDKRVFIAPTLDYAYTARYLSALAAVFTAAATTPIRNSSTYNDANYAYSVFGRFCHGWGAEKRGRQSKLTRDLNDWSESLPIEASTHKNAFISEFNERVCRRFGDWPGLITAYNACSSQLNRRLMLKDLSVGGSNMTASFVKIVDEVLQQSLAIKAEWEETMKKCSEFLYFYACEVSAMASSDSEEIDGDVDVEFKDIINSHLALPKLMSTNPACCCYGVVTSHRRMKVQLSQDLHSLLQPQANSELLELKAVTEFTVIHSHQSNLSDAFNYEINQWASVVVSDTAFGVVRESDYLDIFVIPGVVVLENILRVLDETNDFTNGDQTSVDVRIITKVCEYFHSAILKCALPSRSPNKTIQKLIVFENLAHINASHGAVGALNSALLQQESTSEVIDPSTPCISLRKTPKKKSAALDTPSAFYTISSAQRVRSKALWYIALLQAYFPLVYDVQCYFAKNAAEAKDFVSLLSVEMFRQALLVQ